MKQNIFLPAMLIATLILVSTHAFTTNESKNDQKAINYGYSTNGGSAEADQPQPIKSFSPIWYVIFCDDEHERRFYEFHFTRKETGGQLCKLWCILARLLVVASHLSVLAYSLKALILL